MDSKLREASGEAAHLLSDACIQPARSDVASDHPEGANFLALDLAQEIATGKRTVEDARRMYAEQIMAMKAGGSGPAVRTEGRRAGLHHFGGRRRPLAGDRRWAAWGASGGRSAG